MVFDLGGYEGQWASDIFSKYCCTIHIFEPVHEFASKIQERFKYNQKIYTHEFGLSNENKTVSISLSKDSSSIYKRNGEQTTAILMRAVDFMRENSIKKIDLMKINIEGGEYDLLEHLIDSDFIRNIDNVQIQFHDFVSDAFHRMSNIQHFLSRTHITTYQYPFVWENWMRKR
jgi:FkbM family methyltransferase